MFKYVLHSICHLQPVDQEIIIPAPHVLLNRSLNHDFGKTTFGNTCTVPKVWEKKAQKLFASEEFTVVGTLAWI